MSGTVTAKLYTADYDEQSVSQVEVESDSSLQSTVSGLRLSQANCFVGESRVLLRNDTVSDVGAVELTFELIATSLITLTEKVLDLTETGVHRLFMVE